MGYRYQLISDVCVPKEEELPEWFKEKYKSHIDFSGDYWKSWSECKGYLDITEDTQKVLKELDKTDSIQLVFFADEGLSMYEKPDITHILITRNQVVCDEDIYSSMSWLSDEYKG